MAKKDEEWRNASNPEAGMPKNCNVIEFGSKEKGKYKVELGENASREVPQEVQEAVIKAYKGGSELIKENEK